MNNFNTLFILFIIYSFIGWFFEEISSTIRNKKITDRGFLIGPICPIYGFGAILMISLLTKYKNNIILLFIMSIILFSVLEYFTSYIMEKLFNTRWWDYSDRKYNIRGRICLENMLYFGILGILTMHIIHPFILNIVISLKYKTIIFQILFIFLIIDISVSLYIIINYKLTLNNQNKDATEEISIKVKEILLKRGILYRRLIKAFPNIKSRIK